MTRKNNRRNPFLTAVEKGAQARREGKKRFDNPYSDSRTWHGGVTFSRAWWRAWNKGFDSEEV